MYLRIVVSVCVLLAASVAAVPQRLSAEVNFMQFVAQSRDLSRNDPARSLSCFEYYSPILNEIAANYEREYTKCLQKAEDERASIDDETQPERQKIDEVAENSCQLLKDCSVLQSSVEYFECYANAGNANAKSMYTLSADAAEILAQVQEEYRLVDNRQYVCTNASDRAYVEDTARTYEELNKCLRGESTVPPNTTQEPGTSPSSQAPDTTQSTQESSSQAPDTTQSTQESSSQAPDTTQSSQESSSQAPDTTQSSQESSSQAPDTTQSSQESSSQAPDTTQSSQAPDTTQSSESEELPEEDLSVYTNAINKFFEKLRKRIRNPRHNL